MAGRDEAAAELEVLFPDVEISVRDPDTGEAVWLTVREFRFLEGLRVQTLARPFIDALAAIISERGEDEIEPSAIAEILGDHAEVWLELVARACGREAAWLARLCDADGDAVSEAMWQANGSFFMRRVVASAAARTKAQAPRSPSPRSSTPSSAQDTDEGTTTSPDG